MRNTIPSRRRFLEGMAAGTVLLAGQKRAAAAGPGPIRAGAAALKITPKLGVSLNGTIMKMGPVTAIHDDLHTRCVVLDDGTARLAIVVSDLTVIPEPVFERAKTMARKTTGIPKDRMLMTATHTHSAPRLGIESGELDIEYSAYVASQMAAAVKAAADNLAPARIGWAVGEQPEFTFNRRWFMKPGAIPPDPFGNTTDKVRFNPPPGNENLVKPAGPVDPEFRVLSIKHADGRPLAILANYSIHYAGGFVRGEVSADYFGVFARRLEARLGRDDGRPPFVGIMSNGTSGNIGAGMSFEKPRTKKDSYVHMDDVGSALAEDVYRSYRDIEHADSLSLAMAEKEIELAARKPDAERLAWARDLLARPDAETPHHWSRIYAREALELAEMPAKVSVKLQAIRIGGLGIGATPCETFVETGLAIKEASPLQPTFVMELANQYLGYLPTRRHHELGGYETWPARSSCLEVDAEAAIRAGILELLGKVSQSA